MSDAEPNDERLLRLWVDNQARVYRYVFALLPNPADAQDALQSTCLALWRKAAELDLDRPFLPLAFRFALMEVRKHRKRNRRWERVLDDPTLEALARERADAEDRLEARRHALAGCVGKLGPADRDLIDRHYRRRMTVPDVAAVTGGNVHTLYKALQRVRRQLRECVTAALRAGGDHE